MVCSAHSLYVVWIFFCVVTPDAMTEFCHNLSTYALSKSNHERALDFDRTTELVKSIDLQNMIFENKRKNQEVGPEKVKSWRKTRIFFEEDVDQVTLVEQEAVSTILESKKILFPKSTISYIICHKRSNKLRLLNRKKLKTIQILYQNCKQ